MIIAVEKTVITISKQLFVGMFTQVVRRVKKTIVY